MSPAYKSYLVKHKDIAFDLRSLKEEYRVATGLGDIAEARRLSKLIGEVQKELHELEKTSPYEKNGNRKAHNV